MAREFKDSGIEWIGQIPKEWEASKLKYLTTILQSGGTPTSSNASLYCEDGTSWVAIGDMRHCGEISYTQKHLTDEGLKEKSLIVFPVGTLLYSIYASVGKVSILGIPAAINQAILAISLNEKAKQEYAKFVLTSMENYVFSLANGNTQFNLNAGIVSNFVLPLPSLLSQQRIADYLDKICGEVDEMVALQETMIEELKAYKQSVITEAVTKGLNPNAPMHDSGIDWIGEIPEHWEVIKLSFLTSKIGSGSTPTGGANVYVHEGVKFLRSQNVYFEGLNLNDVAFITETIDEEMKGTRVKPGDVLLNITGGSIGRCYYVDESLGRANVNQHVSIIRPTKIETIYLKYSLQSDLGQNQIALLQTGGNREGLSAAALSNFKILFPPMSEQRTIASYLDTKCSEIDSLIALKQAKIEELKEYKKSVIYEYVTGKKEVV